MPQSETGLLVELVRKNRGDWTGASDEIHTQVDRVYPMKGTIVIEFLGDERAITYPREE